MLFVGFRKTLIEVISGENLITHEKLSFLERVIAGVSLIPIGAIAKWLKGVFKGGINSLLRRVGKSAITDIVLNIKLFNAKFLTLFDVKSI